MRRDQVAIDVEQRGIWRPYRVTITLPAGFQITGRGWTGNRALKNAVKVARSIMGSVEENEE